MLEDNPVRLQFYDGIVKNGGWGGEWRARLKGTSPVVDRQLVTFFCFAKSKVTKENEVSV
jgi:hypothetical protein